MPPLSGKNTGVGCHFLLQGIFLDQRLNLCLLHWQVDSLPLSPLGSPLGHMLVRKSIPLWAGETTVTKPALFLNLCSNSDAALSPCRYFLLSPSGHVTSHSTSLPRAHIFPTTSYNWHPHAPWASQR